VDVLGARVRADHRSHPPAAAFASDVPGPEIRDLLVLSAQARLRSARGADPVPPLESAVGGDDLLRLRLYPLKLTKFAKKLDDGKYAYSWYENAQDGGGAEEAAVDGDASGAGLTSHF
jgi:hypothetical protein